MGIFSIHSLVNRGNNIVMLSIITMATFTLMSCLRPDRFPTERNLVSMSFLFPELGILAFAMMLAMLTGGIDLSLVGTANLSSILIGFTMVKLAPRGAPAEKAILVIVMGVAMAIVIGAVCGLLNGFIIAKFRVPPILATLGTMQLFTGIAMVLTKGTAVIGFPAQYSRIGNGALGYFSYPLILFIVLLLVFYVMQKRTYLGVKLYLVGSNAKAAAFAGINVTRTLITSYIMSGVLAALAGIIMSSRTNAAKADFGSSYTLQAILVAVLGGINPNGGSGNVMGILMAVLSLQFLSSGFTMLRFSNFTKDFVWGAFLLVIMIVNYFLYERKKTV